MVFPPYLTFALVHRHISSIYSIGTPHFALYLYQHSAADCAHTLTPPIAMRCLLVVTKAVKGVSNLLFRYDEGGNRVKTPHGICQDQETKEFWVLKATLSTLFPKTGRWNCVSSPLLEQ